MAPRVVRSALVGAAACATTVILQGCKAPNWWTAVSSKCGELTERLAFGKPCEDDDANCEEHDEEHGECEQALAEATDACSMDEPTVQGGQEAAAVPEEEAAEEPPKKAKEQEEDQELVFESDSDFDGGGPPLSDSEDDVVDSLPTSKSNSFTGISTRAVAGSVGEDSGLSDPSLLTQTIRAASVEVPTTPIEEGDYFSAHSGGSDADLSSDALPAKERLAHPKSPKTATSETTALARSPVPEAALASPAATDAAPAAAETEAGGSAAAGVGADGQKKNGNKKRKKKKSGKKKGGGGGAAVEACVAKHLAAHAPGLFSAPAASTPAAGGGAAALIAVAALALVGIVAKRSHARRMAAREALAPAAMELQTA